MTGWMTLAQHGALIALLIIAAIWDGRHGRIPNWLTGSGCAAGLLLCLWTFIAADNSVAISLVVGGMIGGGAMLLLYLGGGVGGGDVKLMAAVGLLGGYPAVVPYLFYGMLAALIMILGRLAWRGELWATAGTIIRAKPRILAPGEGVSSARPSASFALALGVGVIWVQVMTLL